MKLIKLIFFIFLISSTLCYSQSNQPELSFDTKFIDAVDKWVAFAANEKDAAFPFGFIYIDQEAGFTFHYESTFKIIDGKFVPQPKDSTKMLKVRLQPQTKPVAVLNDRQIEQLNLANEPEWLKIYKEDKNKASYLQRMGYHYNHPGASEKALEYLEKAYTIEPQYEGVEFELAYAYNATKQFQKAIVILEKAIKNNPDNAFFYKELGFAYQYLDEVDKAEQTYRKGIIIASDDFFKSEMAVNMAQTYFKLRNRGKFSEWAQLTKKYAAKDSSFLQFIEYYQNNWDTEK